MSQLGRKLHRAIFDAIASHDADAGERAMREHMQTVLKRFAVSETLRPNWGTR